VLEADDQLSGRFRPGQLSDTDRTLALTVPAPGEGWVELLYANGLAEAIVTSSDGASRTRVAWDNAFFPHLWICTVSGMFGWDLAFLFCPASSRPFRLEDADAAGTAVSIPTNESRTWWTEVESLDPI
jgi:hypothetical protein